MSATVREVICEAITDGLSPEVAANMLLEPSKWKQKLFDPTRDLSTLYKQYLRGDLGVGVLSDAVAQVLEASNDMSDLTDAIVQTYGRDATPGDIPEESEVGEINIEDEKVEVLVRDNDEFVTRIVEHIRDFWPAEILAGLYGDSLTEQEQPGVGPARIAGAAWGPGITQATQMMAPPALKRTREIMPGEPLRPDTLQAFEQGKVLNNIYQSAMDIFDARKQIARLYQAQKWAELAQLYAPGGDLELNLGYLAGDMMVLKDIADGAVRSGYGDRPIGGTAPVAAPPQQEAWQPALLDDSIGREISELVSVLNSALSGRLTYGELQQAIQPFVHTNSAIFKLARKGRGRSPHAAPYAADRDALQRLVTQAVAPEPEPETPVGADRPYGAEEELPVPPPEEEPLPAPEPEAPRPGVSAAVAGAAAGAEPELGDILGDVLSTPEQVPDAQRLQGLLQLQPNRAEQFVQYMQRKGVQPGIVVREISDAYKALAELENIRGEDPVTAYQRRYKAKAPIIAKAIAAELKKMLERGEPVQSGPLMAAGLAAQKS
jgi:hypothetical protein